jgi:2-haloacid dehalogenase
MSRWITFDCYGTLLDWQSAFRRAVEPVAAGRTDELVKAFHAAEPDVEHEQPTASYKTVLREALARGAAATGLEIDRELLVANWHTIEAFPDTADALRSLREQGFKIGILTNCDDDLFESTRAALGVEIDLVVTAEQVRSYKPALGHFERFQATSGVRREDWVHAGVSWFHDMVPAQELGLTRVWVDRERSGHDASIVTHHVHDMAGLAALRL